jgi:hypothetical protein
MSRRRWLGRVAAAAATAIAPLVVGCPSPRDGLDRTSLPDDVRGDYDLFAQRCSKCHALARPLDSGIRDDVWWARYVARMRRMPSSGISEGDTVPILRFLHWYSTSPLSPAATVVVAPPPEPPPEPPEPLRAPMPMSSTSASASASASGGAP